MHTTAYPSDFEHSSGPSVDQLQRWGALAAAAAVIGYGVSRRSVPGLLMAAGAAPLAYRGVTGRWPAACESLVSSSGDTRARSRAGAASTCANRSASSVRSTRSTASGRGSRTCRRSWRTSPSVTDLGGGRSHWVARGPGGFRVEWDAEIINQIQNKVLAWKSLPGGDVVSAGSVTFEPARGTTRGTQLTVTLQYEPPAGQFGKLVASAFGREPSQTIREDLRRLKQLLEAGEIAKAAGAAGTSAGAADEGGLLLRQGGHPRRAGARSADPQPARRHRQGHGDRDLRLRPAPLRRLHPDDGARRHPRPRVHGRGRRGRHAATIG